MKKTFLVVTGLVALVTLTLSFTTTFYPPKFKNLKILPKDISKEDLHKIMDQYSIALNVKCDFCHVHNEEKKTWDMASDENPYKLISRRMMIMTNTINRSFFKPEGAAKNQKLIETVTCYTCHKGEAIPVSSPENKEEIK